MNVIIVLDYHRGCVDIIDNIPALEQLPPPYYDYEDWLQDIYEYNLDEIKWMEIEVKEGERLPIHVINRVPTSE